MYLKNAVSASLAASGTGNSAYLYAKDFGNGTVQSTTFADTTTYTRLSLTFTTNGAPTSGSVGLWRDATMGTGTIFVDDLALTEGNVTTTDDSVQGSGTNQFNYQGAGWGHCTLSSCGTDVAFNNSNSYDNTTNDKVTIAFTGTRIAFYAVKANNHGIVAIAIDGATETAIDLYAPTRQGNVLVYTSPTLSVGSHTLAVRVKTRTARTPTLP